MKLVSSFGLFSITTGGSIIKNQQHYQQQQLSTPTLIGAGSRRNCNILRTSLLTLSLSRRQLSSWSSSVDSVSSQQQHRQIYQRTKQTTAIFSSTTTSLFLSSRLEQFDDENNNQRGATIISSSEEASPEILARWERMYQEGERAKYDDLSSTMTGSDIQDDECTNQYGNKRSEVRVVTFDLDNTLWKTSGTINAANDALNTYLEANNISVPRRIEKVMGDLFQADRKKYCPICDERTNKIVNENNRNHGDDGDEPCCKAPVLLTRLRTDAIRHVLETENEYDHERAVHFARTAFEVWTQARHDAIADNMAPGVVETLRTIRSTIQNSNGMPVLIGAITDGNSNPSRVEALRPYFDFCINAESIGVAKPDKRVYLEAVRIIASQGHFSNLLPTTSTTNGQSTVHDHDDETLESIVGPYWCHVGDDFLKDIVAAKNMNMRSIWAIGLVEDKLKAQTDKSKSLQDHETSMDMGEFMKKVSSQSVVSLGIGADDYLAASLTGEFVDAVAQDFSDIGRILLEWHAESYDDTSKVPSSETRVPSDADFSPSDLPPVTAVINARSKEGVDFIVPRAFRIVRERYSMDVPAPLKNREDRTMKDVMSMAQLDKTSGVFALPPGDVASLQEGKKVLMIQIGKTDLQFSREIFSAMSVEEVISLTDENPITLTLSLKEAADQPSFDVF